MDLLFQNRSFQKMRTLFIQFHPRGKEIFEKKVKFLTIYSESLKTGPQKGVE